MSNDSFMNILHLVEPLISGERTHLREPVSAGEKLTVTLRFIATGETYKSLGFKYRMSHSTISLFVPKVFDAIYNELKDEHFKLPSTREEWLKLAENAEKKCQFPNAFGAAKGKH